jgi:hypothetical protein
VWGGLKKQFPMIKWNMHPKRIDDILNTFCIKRIVKTYKLYTFTIKRISDYNTYCVNKYVSKQCEGELYLPHLPKIDYITDLIKERGYLWRSPQEMTRYMPILIQSGMVFENLNIDYLDVSRGVNNEKHLHPSIVTLTLDPFKD